MAFPKENFSDDIDWTFVSDGMKSVLWLMNCNDLPEKVGSHEALNTTMEQMMEATFGQKHHNYRLLNDAVLMMAAYLYFVYPKEKLNEIDLTNISVDDFKIIEEEKPHDKKKLIRRIRNSIAHARYEIESCVITFIDFVPPDKSDWVKFQIPTEPFGDFIEQFRVEVYKQKMK